MANSVRVDELIEEVRQTTRMCQASAEQFIAAMRARDEAEPADKRQAMELANQMLTGHTLTCSQREAAEKALLRTIQEEVLNEAQANPTQ